MDVYKIMWLNRTPSILTLGTLFFFMRQNKDMAHQTRIITVHSRKCLL